jgi:hypothetical protein
MLFRLLLSERVCRNWHLEIISGCRGFIGPVPLPLWIRVAGRISKRGQGVKGEEWAVYDRDEALMEYALAKKPYAGAERVPLRCSVA